MTLRDQNTKLFQNSGDEPPEYSLGNMSLGDNPTELKVELDEVNAQARDIPQTTAGETERIDIRPGDVVIAVMGVTGVGKSTFISHLTKDSANLTIGHTLEACTSNVGIHECSSESGKRFFLIDTPGFDDTYKSDTDILREVANWLREAYENKIELTGIIYLHRILDVRLGGSAMKNLRMFKKLCGDEGLASVVLATTMWNNVEEPTALQREHQLMTKPAFWAGMIAKGSRVFRQDREAESAMEIVNYLIARKRPVILDIQRQMVEEHMTLDQTGAGAEVQAEIARQKAIYEKKLDEIKEEMRDAMKAKDKEAQEELAALREEIQEKIRKDEEDKIKLQADKDDLRRQMDEQFAEERRAWMGKIEEIQANARRDQETRDKLQAEKDALRTKLEEQREKQNKDYYNALHENQTRIAQNQQQVEMMRLQHEKDLEIQRINFRLEQEAKESRAWQRKYEKEQSSCVVM